MNQKQGILKRKIKADTGRNLCTLVKGEPGGNLIEEKQ
jgi:hypothetical protein